MKQEWRVIPEYPRYEVSSTGFVRGVESGTHRKRLKLIEQNNGYCTVTLSCKGKKRKILTVSRLVASAFLPNQLSLPQVNHKNGKKSDNRVTNLEWCTASWNINHAYKTGLLNAVRGEKHYQAKLTESAVRNIRKSSKFQKVLAKKFGVDQGLISKVKNYKIWTHVYE